MAEYSVGVATKSKIYAVAKRLFLRYGPHETSYSQICGEAGVNKGLIPYYFKSKMNIAILVYRDFVASIDGALLEYWGEGALTSPERNIIFELLMFRLLRDDPDVLRFYSQVMNDPECHEATIGMQKQVMEEMASGSNVSIDGDALRSIICMLNGVEAELVLALEKGFITEPIEELVRRDILTCYFLLGSSIDQVRAWIDEGFEKARGLTLSCSEDFEIHVIEQG